MLEVPSHALPAGHRAHLGVCDSAVLPVSYALPVHVQEVLPSSLSVAPSPQGMHALCTGRGWKCPGWHAEHAWFEYPSPTDPAGQSRQVVWPTFGWDWPNPQGVMTSLPSQLYPLGQGVHES